MMQLVIYLDLLGLEKVEVTYMGETERAEDHRLFVALRGELEILDAAVKRAAEVIEREHPECHP